MVDNGEPLAHELSAFLDAIQTDAEPVVTAEDGLRALELATRVDDLASRRTAEVAP
jgi:predicted dehydrogenase